MQIRIGNLNVMTTEMQLATLFFPYGTVTSSRVVNSGTRARLQAVGFIEMEKSSGIKAIRKLHRLLFMNSYIEVQEVS